MLHIHILTNIGTINTLYNFNRVDMTRYSKDKVTIIQMCLATRAR